MKLLAPILLAGLTAVGLSGCSDVSADRTGAEIPLAEPERDAAAATKVGMLGKSLRGRSTADRGSSSQAGSGLRFADVHDEAGLDFVYDNGASPAKLMVQSTGGGAGWLDYDGDHWYDLYLPQAGDPRVDPHGDHRLDELYRNRGDGTFRQVTEQAGLFSSGYGHGVAVGDFDNDGFDDVYVTNVGPDVLWKNMGDGTFQDATRASGIHSPLWSSGAAWGDLDGDQQLDLYVCNYVDYDPLHPIACFGENGRPGICHPESVDGVPNQCYFNRGDGRFVERADQRGLNASGSKSLGVVIADFNRDGISDVFVANDTTANHLFVGLGEGTFREEGTAQGCAMSGLGQYQASMGVGFGDYDHNGYPDLYLTHFTTDSNTLYRNLGSSGFVDTTRETGLHRPTLPYLGFGTVMADLDCDGWEDLFIANGHIDDWRETEGDLFHMPAQLFAFDGRRWHERRQTAGSYFRQERLGRAVASADYDADGDLDLVVIHQNAPLALLRNESQTGHWLKCSFIGRESNRRGIGVEVTVRQADGQWVRQLPGGTSYCASHQPALFFGLGENAEPCQVAVRWPTGKRQTLSEVAVDQWLRLDEVEAEAP